MALGALIGAYQEDDSGGLRALIPLAGRTLLEYQVRCAAAAAAAPIVIVVERVPQALQDAFERLRLDGIGVFPVSDVHEAVSRFEAGAMILLIGDAIAPPADLIARLAEEPEPAVATVPDDETHEAFERIDAETRWAGVALVDARTLGSTAAMLGDWDLQSTLLRRTIQDGALRLPASGDGAEPLLVERAEQLDGFQRRLVAGSREARRDWASRFVLPPVEDLGTHWLMETSLRPAWLVWIALALTLAAAGAFSRGWLGAGLVLLVAVNSARHDRRPPRDHPPATAAEAHDRPDPAVAGSRTCAPHARLVGGAPGQRLGRVHGRDRCRRLRRSDPPRRRGRLSRRPLAAVAPQRDLPGGPVRPVRSVDGLSRRPLCLCRSQLLRRPARAADRARVDPKLTEIG